MSQVLQKKLISVHDFTTYKLGDSSIIFFILLSNNLNPLFLLGHFQPPMSDRNLSANPATVDILYSGIFKSKLKIFFIFFKFGNLFLPNVVVKNDCEERKINFYIFGVTITK